MSWISGGREFHTSVKDQSSNDFKHDGRTPNYQVVYKLKKDQVETPGGGLITRVSPIQSFMDCWIHHLMFS